MVSRPLRAASLALALLAGALAPAAAEPGRLAPNGASAPPAPSARGWKHKRNRYLVTEMGAARHSVADQVVNPDQTTALRGKFSYGAASKDLEDEAVVVWLRRPGGRWRELGTARTDSDGRIALPVNPILLEAPGAYDVEMIVAGDGSRARGGLWVVAADTPTVVFDVDGTLTTGDDELAEEVLTGRDPDMYEGADQVARHWAAAGYLPVYLTGRPYYLDGTTRRWLKARGFPAGPIIVTDRVRDGVAGSRVLRFKLARLTALAQGARLRLDRAYGNAVTDTCVYARAGIAPERTFIIGKHGRQACEGFPAPRAVSTYPNHLAELTPTP